MRTGGYTAAIPVRAVFDARGWVSAKVVREPSRFFVGVDLGQAQDFTTVAVVERAELVAQERDPATMEFREETRYWLRHIERVRLGTPYPEVVARVREIARTDALLGRSTVVVDATGVGAPVVDLLQRAELGSTVVPVVITGADVESSDGSTWRVPKRNLMTGLQVAFQTERLEMSGGLSALGDLLEELRGMRVKMSPDGFERFGGKRDDLVLAVALAWWRASRYLPVHGRRRVV